jgi:hypothetical protein
MGNEIIMPEALGLIKQEESLKIEKNSKSVNWEYRLIGNVEEQIKRIDAIENLLKSKFEKGGK